VGKPLSPEQSRRLLALRINVLAKGYSGISLGVLQQYIDAFNGMCRRGGRRGVGYRSRGGL
jgi:histidine ammonia-lyase